MSVKGFHGGSEPVWTRATAIVALRALGDHLKRKPTARDVCAGGSGCPKPRALKRIFGDSWFRKYLAAAGYTPTNKGPARRRWCRKGIHPMRGENVAITMPRGTERKDRRCVPCRRERELKYPTTIAGRAALSAQVQARRIARDERAKAHVRDTASYWRSQTNATITVRRVVG